MTPARPDPPPPGWADALQQAHRAFAQAERRWRESLAEVQAQLADLQTRHAALQDEHSGCAERLLNAESAGAELAQRLGQVQAEAGQLRADAAALELQLDPLRAELAEAQRRLLQAQQHDAEQRETEAGRLADAQARLLQFGALLDSSRVELRESQQQQRRLLANVEALTSRLEQSQADAAAQREVFERERQSLAVRLAERDSEWQSWRDREQQAHEQAARQDQELRQALEAARDALTELREQHQQDLATHELARQSSSRDLLQATAARDLAQALLQDRTAEAESLRRELQRLTAGLTQLAETTARQQAAVQEQLAVAERRLEDRTRQLERSERVVTDLRQQLGSAHHDLDRLRLDLAEQTRRGAERELAETRRWQDLHTELDTQHERERIELTSRMEALAAAGRDLQAQLGHSRDVAGTLQAQLDQLGEQRAHEREQASAALQGARAELAMAQEAFRALAATRTMALESLDELREQQRLRWVQEHASETLTVIANLRTLLDDAVSRRDELATELMVLRNMAQTVPPPVEPVPAPTVASLPVAAPVGAPVASAVAPPDDHPPPAQAAAPPEPADTASERPAAAAPPARPSEPLPPTAMAMNTPHSVQDLLTLFDEAFVQACYRLVLGREADGPGLATHLALLRQGVAKEQLIIALAGSEEGRLAARPVAGLDELVRQASEVPTGLRGRVMRRLAAEAGTLSRQDLASVENRFGAALQAVQGEQQRVRTGQDELVQRMATLVQHVEQLGQRLQGRLDRLDAGQAELAVVLARQDQSLARCEAACAGIARQVQALGGVLSVPAGQIDGALAAAAASVASGSPPPGEPGAGMPLHSVASVRQLLASPGGAA